MRVVEETLFAVAIILMAAAIVIRLSGGSGYGGYAGTADIFIFICYFISRVERGISFEWLTSKK